MPYWKRLHHQCAWCNVMTAGPHKGKQPGKQVHFVNEENGEMLSEEEGRDRAMTDDDYNVSHGACPECQERVMAEWQREREERKAREAAQAAEADSQ